MKKYVEINNGKLELNLPNGFYEIVIYDLKSERTLQQMKFYWGAIIPAIKDFFEAIGKSFNEHECHLRFKEMAGLYTEVLALDMEKFYATGEILYIKTYKYKSFAVGKRMNKAMFQEAYDKVNNALIEYSGGNFQLPEATKLIK
jgi:hypothetical protein